MFERMRAKATATPAEPEAAPGQPPTEPAEPETPETPEKPEAPETTPAEPAKAAEADKTPKAKVNPWKLLDEWKAKYGELEKQHLETKKLIPDEAARKSEVERLTAAEKRAQELESEIKFVNYRKSAEFKEKYEKPYEQAWARAMGELSELEVVNPDTGESRKPAPQDLLSIVNAPSIVKAKQIATELFGEFADEVMAHRKEVRRLYDEQAAALKRAYEEGSEREKTLAQQYETTNKELQKFAHETWQKYHEASLSDQENGSFFKPVEGDDERNSTLQKGYELVDSGSSENPLNPALTSEQRAAIIRKHVAIRNRAAAYGVIKHEYKKLQAQLAEVQEKLKQYESSTPTTEGGARPASAPVNGRASDRIYAKLRSLAK